ncbi:MAG: YqeG family HAD IIIA-type phosphatase [Lentilactobacillus diolivorans]|uniref:HAD superfamily hydrolase n=2 Tax=Lentilactobacillus diolivorans TaxID=179838 RepID=A0A0R1SDD8_9LACO|nr:YqeG family HAD IIIA-type phosphatase [Lentilactobacillus diolivorans]RRG00773.1 MAG: YqeG family HAD IIIA-type phosphatase [Lactobacillus sp.]KRL64586.1 HAD superfamily hydrolase [Lentilactobacillus diolivorans DSM 14421]MCH4164555.1 YqeG family HAD IIIA-type phosphatase [Lentilactobacillus diolivorans]MDH5104278.1 YqeG family HAD IIIA-type phosphatase [Lentilactobacillus diolivorans]GEP22847.1 haloacid dehalogenase [Lentilactobacillus diolivorans]
MLSRFKPTWMIENIFSISPQFLLDNNINCVLTDLDNTLVPWNSKQGSAELRDWLLDIKKYGIKVIVVSNNSHRRIKEAVKDYELPFVPRAMKPLTIGIRHAIKEFHLTKKNTVMVGDQLLTDVVSANSCRVRSILVKPLVRNDAWNTTINRYFERIIWNKLIKKYPNLHWK